LRLRAQHARLVAAALATAATVFFLIVPVYESSGGSPRRLLEVAPRALVVILIPPLLATIPVAPRSPRARRIGTAVAAVLLTVAALLGMFTVGFFYVPSAVALIAAALLPESDPRAS
jgi:hypothetical protein